MSPGYSQRELDHFCRPPQRRLRDAAAGGPQEMAACFAHMLGLVGDIANLYTRWSAATVGWLLDRHGIDAAAEVTAYHELWPAGAPRLDADQLALVRSVLRGANDTVSQRVAALAQAGGTDDVVAYWDMVSEALDVAEAMRRDAVTAQLTVIARRHGDAELEDCLRYAADRVWLPRMAADLACAPEVRVRNWAEKMAIGHNGAVTVRELPDRWVITLDPCGSCGRQLLAGRYDPPWDFAFVQPGKRIGFLRDDITVYQAHLAVAHTLVPIERTGAPWPAISCAGRAARPCELVLFRDPGRTDAKYYEQVGTRAQPAASR